MKLKKLVNLIKRTRGNQKLYLTNEQKVSESRIRIENSLSMFSDINDEINDINDTLSTVIEEDSYKQIKLQQNIDRANDELKANQALQEKVKQFIL